MAWLIKAVNPDVPLGEAALGLILEEVRTSWASGMGGLVLEARQLGSKGEDGPCELKAVHAACWQQAGTPGTF